MTKPTHRQRLRARIDRLPASWKIIAVGFLAQCVLAVSLLGLAFTDDDIIGMTVAAFLLSVTIVAGLMAVPSFIFLWRGRYHKVAAVLAGVVGTGTLAVTEAHATSLLFPLALLIAAVRAWVRASLGPTELLDIDPERFERVEPPGEQSEE